VDNKRITNKKHRENKLKQNITEGKQQKNSSQSQAAIFPFFLKL